VNQFRSLFSFVNVVGLQECREACGGQGIKSDNRIGQAKAEYDVQSTFEGDNNVLMQQVDICCSSIAFKKSVQFDSLNIAHCIGLLAQRFMNCLLGGSR
jgi:acyl-CoA oxidase